MTRRYLEPGTDVPAAEDWSTRLILAWDKSASRGIGAAVAVVALAIVWVAVFLPASPGNVASLVVLGLVCVLGLFSLLGMLLDAPSWQRELLTGPWRRCQATVAVCEDDPYTDRVMIFDDGATVVLRGFLQDALSMVLDQQELFLCGPNEKGRAIMRVHGLCRIFAVRVDGKAQVRPREREPHVPGRPLDDPAVVKALRYFRWGARPWIFSAIPAALGGTLVALSLSPLAVTGLVIGGLLFAAAGLALTLLPIRPWYREAVAKLTSAKEWMPVPITLFEWESAAEVAGLAQLPGGGVAAVVFPLPQQDVLANIADTGTMWVAGLPNGVVAVGVPRVPALTIAVVQRDRDHPDDTPQPWLLRTREPGLHEIPALRR